MKTEWHEVSMVRGLGDSLLLPQRKKEGDTEMLQIAPSKVEQIIELAREFDAKVAPWDEASSEERQSDVEAVLEATSDDPIAQELKSLIDNLNEDEQVSLVAIMWVGRGTFEPEDFDEALSTARTERVNETSDYLLGVPLLGDYLEEGLARLGRSDDAGEAED